MDERQILIDAWKQTIAVQMHFNDIAMKIRAFALTLVAAILTAQSFAAVRVVWLPIVAALGCWLAFYLMDRWWYHYLLLGAVLHGSNLEEQGRSLGLEFTLPTKQLITRPLLGVTNRISELNREGFPFAAKYKMDLYYLLVGVGIFLILPARTEFSSAMWLVSGAAIFTLGAAWLAAAVRGNMRARGVLFDNENGAFVAPDISILGGRLIRGNLPLQLNCGDIVHIYSSDARNVNNCQGFGGANDNNNATCQTADAAAQRAAAQISCPTDCPKAVTEVFRGWSCSTDRGITTSLCAVELKVECLVTP